MAAAAALFQEPFASASRKSTGLNRGADASPHDVATAPVSNAIAARSPVRPETMAQVSAAPLHLFSRPVPAPAGLGRGFPNERRLKLQGSECDASTHH